MSHVDGELKQIKIEPPTPLFSRYTMSKLFSTRDIKFTMIFLPDEEVMQASDMVERYLQKVDFETLTDIPSQANSIYGFANSHMFWHPVLDPDGSEDHWSVPIVNDYDAECLMILQTSPNSEQMKKAIFDITGQDEYIVTIYDTWRLDAGYAAVVTDST